MRIILLLLSAMAAVPASAETLHLVCMGGGHANKDDGTAVHAGNSRGETAWATIDGTQAVGFNDQVNVDITDAAGRIRMPRIMLPPIHGGKDGWMEIQKLNVGDREITGSVGVNFANNPKLRIDRITGVLSLSGKAGSFSGQCKAYDPAAAVRAF